MALVATTFGGRMTINLEHPEPLIGKERGARISDRTLTLLRGAL
jgi:hypothetical protein